MENCQHSMDESTESAVKELQSAIYDIFEEVIKVLDKHNLTYSLVAGTLLGAIRHKGFIPWDDDLDIIMPREDFEKFREIANKELPENLFFQDYTTDEEYPSIYAKVRNSNTTLIENGYRFLKKMNQGIFIDIFVADRYKDSNKNLFRRKIIKLFDYILLSQNNADTNKVKKSLCKLFPRKFLFKQTEKILRKMNSEKGSDKYILANHDILPYYTFDDLTEVPFGRLSAKASAHYHEILTDVFGDYMALPPLEDRKPKHITKHFSTTIPYKEYIEKNL